MIEQVGLGEEASGEEGSVLWLSGLVQSVIDGFSLECDEALCCG